MRSLAAILVLFTCALVLPGGQASASTSLHRGSETHFVHPSKKAPIRFGPRQSSRRITSTHFSTEDGFPEVYLALRKWTNRLGQTWVRLRIPMRPNGRIGWVRSFALGPLYRVNTKLIVNRSRGSAALYNHGRRIWKAPVGTGKQNTPTPPGNFWVREKFKTRDARGTYGPVAFGTSDYSVLTDWPGGGVIGIHGTDQPGLIPGTPSHGCIRVRNGAIRRLFQLMPVGTPILIR
ncbi:MAG: L,D-transpeptidase [Solirubrobacterales bacterium]